MLIPVCVKGGNMEEPKMHVRLHSREGEEGLIACIEGAECFVEIVGESQEQIQRNFRWLIDRLLDFLRGKITNLGFQSATTQDYCYVVFVEVQLVLRFQSDADVPRFFAWMDRAILRPLFQQAGETPALAGFDVVSSLIPAPQKQERELRRGYPLPQAKTLFAYIDRYNAKPRRIHD
jgi:hypothetical protein